MKEGYRKINNAIVHESVVFGEACVVHGGTFHGGTFRGGTFRGGEFIDGTFHGGFFHGGTFWDGTFHGGVFHSGTFHGGSYLGGAFIGGSYLGGTFHGGTFHDGEFIDGSFWGGVFRGADSVWKRSPLYVQGSRHFACESDTVDGELFMTVGCLRKSMESWEKGFDEMTEEHGYSDEEKTEYAKILKFFKELL